MQEVKRVRKKITATEQKKRWDSGQPVRAQQGDIDHLHQECTGWAEDC